VQVVLQHPIPLTLSDLFRHLILLIWVNLSPDIDGHLCQEMIQLLEELPEVPLHPELLELQELPVLLTPHLTHLPLIKLNNHLHPLFSLCHSQCRSHSPKYTPSSLKLNFSPNSPNNNNPSNPLGERMFSHHPLQDKVC
jgi:hypothetical protein